MNYKIITGMSQEYFDNIGKLMLESWIQYWPSNFYITVYTEDIINFNHPRVIFESLDNMEQEYHDFQNAIMKLERRTKTFAKKAWPIINCTKYPVSCNTNQLFDLIPKRAIIPCGQGPVYRLPAIIEVKSQVVKCGEFRNP